MKRAWYKNPLFYILIALGLVCFGLQTMQANAAIAHDGYCDASGAPNSCTFTNTATNDLKLILAICSNAGCMTPISVPGGWTVIATGTNVNVGTWVFGCNVSANPSDTGSGSWTVGGNSVSLEGESFSGTIVGSTANCNTTGVGGFAEAGNNSSTYVFPGVTMEKSDNTSWISALTWDNTTAAACTPAGLTAYSATGNGTIQDTAGGVSSWATSTCTTFNGFWNTVDAEILGVSTPFPVISSFVASPAVVPSGGTSTLSWAVLNASSVTLTPGGYTTSTLIGSTTTPALSATTIYTLSATNATGTSISSTTVFVSPIVDVQGAASTTGGTAASSVSAQTGSNVTTGDYIIATGVCYNLSCTNAVTDSAGNSYTPVAGGNFCDNTDGICEETYYTKIVSGGGSKLTVTNTVNGSQMGVNLAFEEYSGIAANNPFDAVANASGTADTISASVTTNFTNELIYSVTLPVSNASTTGSCTQRQQDDDDVTLSDELSGPTGSYGCTFADTGGFEGWIEQTVAFKSADLTPPSVAWFAPAPNATVTSTITLTASSSDDTAISSTAFYYGPFGASLASSTLIGSTSTGNGTQYSINWNTAPITNGSTTLWALATDTSNNTSSVSETVNVENPPIITGVASTTSLTTSTIIWTTNEAASSQVNYGSNTSYGSSTSNGSFVTSHSITLTNLTPNTIYHFDVLSTDPQGNVATSNDATVKTLVDNTPPSVPTSVVATAASASEIDLSWAASTDNVGVAGYLIYRGGVQIATTTSLSYADTGLSPSTSYSYALVAFDASGNQSATSSVASATTQASGGGGGGGGCQQNCGGGQGTGGGSAYDISINSGASETFTPNVTLSLYGTAAYTMEVSNTSTFADASWIPYATTMPWTLNANQGVETVYVAYRAIGGTVAGSAQASIDLVPGGTSGNGSGSENISLQERLTALQSQLAVLIAAQANQSSQGAGASSGYTFTRDLQLYDRGQDVRVFQQFLITQNAGPAARVLARHGTTQTFGILTYNALREYQKSVGVHATGYFGALTRKYTEGK